MLGIRLTALIVAALSIPALRAQNKAIHAASQTVSQLKERPVIPDVPDTTLPPVIHICIARCGPLLLERGHYVNFGPENTSIYTIESFTRDSLILHRTDKGHFPLTATLTGQISKDGNSVVNGRVEWTSGNTGSAPFRAVWGKEILYPEQDAQDAGQKSKLNIACDASARISIEAAKDRAEQLMEANDLLTSLCWLRIAASQGDSESQGAMAAILYEGIDVPVNVSEAAVWADKAAAQGDYLGDHTLSLMYAKGNGKPKDLAKARYWDARYQKDKLAYEQAQERARQARQQRMDAQAQHNADVAAMMLQILVGAFSADSESPRHSAMGCTAGYAAVCAQTH